MPETIDITPSWADLLPLFLAVIRDGNAEGQQTITAELRRMAQAADLWNTEADRLVSALRFVLNDHNSELDAETVLVIRGALERVEGGQ